MKVVCCMLAAMLSVASLGGCVAPFPPELIAENRDRVAEVLADSYEEVINNYVDPVFASDLAVAGLRKMTQLDPAMSLEVRAQDVSMSLQGETFYSFAKPAAEDADGWGDAIAAALIAARDQSGQLRRHSEMRLLEDHMRGVAASLPREGRYSTDQEIRALIFPQYNSGVQFAFLRREGKLILWRLDPDGRLEAAGLRKGDAVTHLNSLPVVDMTGRELSEQLMGPEGSKLTFTVLRRAEEWPIELEVARWRLRPVGSQLEQHGDVGILRMPYMTPQAIEEVAYRVEIDRANEKHGGERLAGWILDLRGNLGSTDWVYLRLANIFMGKGTVATQSNHRLRPRKVINASWPDKSDNWPLVVLVDGMTSYGAEEVVAGLQDNGRAVVVGASTAGEGVVHTSLSLHKLGDIWLPVALSYAPSGYAFEGRGVLPDICIAKGGSLQSLLTSLRRGEGLPDLADRTRHIDLDDKVALAAHRALCPLVPDPKTFDPADTSAPEGDVAERLALAILNDPDLYRRLLRRSPGLKDPG